MIRKGFNHSFLVETDQGQFVLRIYLNGKYYIRDSQDFLFELELLTFLHSKGLPVVRPVANRWNGLLSTHRAQNATRHLAVFHFVQGVNAEQAVEDGALVRSHVPGIGRSFALIHQVSDSFVSRYHRYHLNLETCLLDEPIRFFERLLAEQDMGDLSFFNERADELRRRISALCKHSPSYGLIHADLNVENILFSKDGHYTIIDFDHCAYGWRAYDFAVAAFQNPDMRDEFLLGYETVRALSDLEKELIPVFVQLSRIWNHYDIARFLPLWGESLSTQHLTAFREELKDLI
ncbi:phosphotransferase [Roseibium sp. HPY-6]|uniref:phosphotransferase enzyme family protein n=1 Tax=Roseibium sp. HPY-6 TaxID=3229852 RepID=UPI00338FD0AC